MAKPDTTQNSPATCEDCGEPATRQTVDGVPLCEGDWQRLLAQAENMGESE